MDAFQLRVLAIVAMVVDHVGLFLLGNTVGFRLVGRLAFPLFAFLVANGFQHTHDVRRYGIRLFLFALISQWPYVWLQQSVFPDFAGLNIFFTLFTGLVGLAAWKKWRVASLPLVGVLAAGAQLLKMDYGWVGVMTIWLFGVFYNRLLVAFGGMALSFGSTTLGYLLGLNPQIDIQIAGVAAIPFIRLYNGKPGYRGLKHWFYWFYPVHLLILGIVARVFARG